MTGKYDETERENVFIISITEADSKFACIMTMTLYQTTCLNIDVEKKN